MAILFIAYPRNGDSDTLNLDQKVQTVSAAYADFLGPRYEKQPERLNNLVNGDGTALLWKPSGQSSFIHKQGGRITLSTTPGTAVDIHNSVRPWSGRMRYSKPVWGHYMAISADSNIDRVTAWSSVPGIESVHFGQDEKFTYISNRPLTIALAMADGNKSRVQLDPEYLAETLNFGHSMSGCSPFLNVRSSRSNGAVSASRQSISEIPGPELPELQLRETSSPFETGVEELTDALLNATQRLITQGNQKKIQLRVSGGKDSRLMLGMLRQFQFDRLTTVTQGDENSEEVHVAAQLAKLAGTEHRTVRPHLNDPQSVKNSFNLSLRQSQGFMLSEALGTPYSVADPITIGEGYAGGHWPIFKSSYERKRAISVQDVDLELGVKNAQILNPELNKDTLDKLWEWRASQVPSTNADLAYLYGRNIRSHYYYHASITSIDGFSQVFYPFMDAEVYAVSDALLSDRRRTEIPLFLTTRRLWSEALAIPLSKGNRYKFEKWAPVQGVSGDDYELRTAPLKRLDIKPPLNNEWLDKADDAELIREPFVSGSRALMDSEHWSTLEPLLGDKLTNQIKVHANAKSESEVLAGMSTKNRRLHSRLYLWRTLLAERWLSKDWLEA